MTKTLKQATPTIDDRPARLAALTAKRDELQATWKRERLGGVYLVGDNPAGPRLSDTSRLRRKAEIALAIDQAERERAELVAALARDELTAIEEAGTVATLTAARAAAATAMADAQQALDAAHLAWADAHARLATVMERVANLRRDVTWQEDAARRWAADHERDTAFREAVDMADRRLAYQAGAAR